jgi:hypothetical protein
LLKGERKLLKRVCELPIDLASAYLDDLKATAEERLAFFEQLAFQRKQAGDLTANSLDLSELSGNTAPAELWILTWHSFKKSDNAERQNVQISNFSISFNTVFQNFE